MTHSPEGAKARADDNQEEDVVDVTIREAASAEDLREIESRIR